jgi:hypothetical protein
LCVLEKNKCLKSFFYKKKCFCLNVQKSVKPLIHSIYFPNSSPESTLHGDPGPLGLFDAGEEGADLGVAVGVEGVTAGRPGVNFMDKMYIRNINLHK